MVKQKIALIILLLGLSFPVFSAVQATVDRNVLSENETLILTFSMTDSSKGKPDLALLKKDFDIVSRSQSSSYSVINGKINNEKKIKVTLFPKHSGQIIIPVFEMGTEKTQTIRIKVNAVGATANAVPKNRPLWIEMTLNDAQVYVQQQMILTLHIYQGVTLLQASLGEPQANGLQFKKMGEDKNYQTVQNGRSLQVTERNYAVFANKSGHFTIKPVQLDGNVAVGGQSFFLQNSKPVRARSNAVEIDVKGIPKQWKHGEWLPARQVIVKDTWSGNDFKVGEPITRTLTLQADGLMANQLPEIFPAKKPFAGLKFYADTPELLNQEKEGKWYSQRREKMAVIPTQTGELTLPSIKIPWWNTIKQRVEMATLPEKTIHVTVGTVVPVAVSESVKPVNTVPLSTQNKSIWMLVAIVSTLGWGLTLLWVFLRNKNQPLTESIEPAATVGTRKLKKAILQACKENDAKACETALLAFARAQWPAQSMTHLGALACITDDELSKAINALERNRYASEGQSQWQGQALLKAFQQARFERTKQNESSVPNGGLPPLYP